MTIKLSVRELVEFVMRSGSIDTHRGGRSRMREGAELHRRVQKRDKEHKENYQSEVYFKHRITRGGIDFELSGRADAVYTVDGVPVVEEIKSSTEPFENFEEKAVHRAQLNFYGLFYINEHDLDSVTLTLHYVHTTTGESLYFPETLTRAELEAAVNAVLDLWLEWGALQADWQQTRDASIVPLAFLYDAFRPGQREISLAVFNTLRHERQTFIEAPTGTGKTAAVLFAAIKFLPDAPQKRVYYLTPKTTIQKEAQKAVDTLREQGLRLRSIVRTARDKLCPMTQAGETRQCNPEACPRASGYYDRVNTALKKALEETDSYTRAYIEMTAKRENLCPFEFSVDLARWCDLIICDYNYVFDPAVQQADADRICLIDEAHNLAPRAREMYSETALPERFEGLEAGKSTEKHARRIVRAIQEINALEVPKPENLKALVKALSAFVLSTEEETENSALSEARVSAYRFLLIAELAAQAPERYVVLKSGTGIRLVCLDASVFISEILSEMPAVFFSATLTPFSYYAALVLGQTRVPALAVPSPFPRENVLVLCDTSVSTAYRFRQMTLPDVSARIQTFVQALGGHVLVCFPSFTYMNQALAQFKATAPDIAVIAQTAGMSARERRAFIKKLKTDTQMPLAAFCVMGGLFAEGIDLPGESVAGCVVVGPGIPSVDDERRALWAYYDAQGASGYDVACRLPGMNRVLQAAGRVIRSEHDRGAMLFLDSRFAEPAYQRLFPSHLHPTFVRGSAPIGAAVERFVEKNKNM